MAKILSYDIGTTGVKTCLYSVDEKIDLIGAASEGYELYTFPDGGAEQHADEWWDAICKSTKEVLAETGEDPASIDGITFCSQMQGLVLVDEEGVPVRHPMSYMDQRASEEMKEGIGKGLKVAGMNAEKLVKSLLITGVVAGSVKDPIWRYLWVKNHEPENFERVYCWLDVKEYVICRMTGEFVMTEDSAWSTMLYDTRRNSRGWSSEICDLFGIDEIHQRQWVALVVVLHRVAETDCAGRPFQGAEVHQNLVFNTARSVGCEPRSLLRIKRIDRLDETDRADRNQIVLLAVGRVVLFDDMRHQPQIVFDQRFARRFISIFTQQPQQLSLPCGRQRRRERRRLFEMQREKEQL